MLKLFNTLKRQIEVFKPLKNKKVRMYSCGPTVYHYAHIGNLRAYIFVDILKRYLKYRNYKVKHVMNITDVGHLTSDADTGEDKIEQEAKKERKTAHEIAEFYTNAFKENLKSLNIIGPDIWAKATEHIKEQIGLIKKLEKKNYIYKTSDGIYFNTSKLKDYGKLAGLKEKGLKGGARVPLGEKKHKTDFALWKFSKKPGLRQQEWNSPWGLGFPGWHIECSAMSIKYLGPSFDIHTGGIDHIPVHHSNEIAQSESATGKKFVNYWLHNAHLIIEGKKMSKSLGNVYILKNISEKGHNPLLLRLILLKTHYRQTLDFSFENFEEAKSIAKNFLNFLIELEAVKNKKKNNLEIDKKISTSRDNFGKSMDDDLNISRALTSIFEFTNDIYKNIEILNTSQAKKIKDYIFEIDGVLGFIKPLYNDYNQKLKKALNDKKIQNLLEKRKELRKNKNYKEADKMRQELLKKNIVVSDTPEGGYEIKLVNLF